MSGFGSFKSSFGKFADDVKGEIKGKDKKSTPNQPLVSSGPPPKPPHPSPNKPAPPPPTSTQSQYQQQPQTQYKPTPPPPTTQQYQQQQQPPQQPQYKPTPPPPTTTHQPQYYPQPPQTHQPSISLEKTYQPQPPANQPQYHPQPTQTHQPAISLEKTYQPGYQDGASNVSPRYSPPQTTTTTTATAPHRPAPPPTRPTYSTPSRSQITPNSQSNLYPQQQQDGASTIEKKSDKLSVPDLKKHQDHAKTNANIALQSIGAPIDTGVIKAKIPPLYLGDQMYLSNIQYTEIVLEIQQATIKSIVNGKKSEAIYKKEKLIIYKTTIDDVIIIQIGDIYIYTNMREKSSIRSRGYHYIISDNYNNFFQLKVVDESTSDEELNKLEVLFTYYSTYFRVPLKEEYEDKTAKKIDKTGEKVEGTSQKIAGGLVSAGGGIAKGAGKLGEVYKNNTKKYDGPEMTEEQKKQLEDPDSEINQTGKSIEKFAQGTASVKQGISKGFGFIGSKASQGVHSTSWYKEKEAKKKEDERINGKNEKKEAAGQAAGSGIGAVKTVFGGLQEGILISSRGIRDSSVDATAHTSGEFAAERSKRRWNAGGNLTISIVNVASILGATTFKALIYVGAGALSYDPDVVNSLGGSFWKAGWLSTRSDLLSGSNWRPRWVVLRNCSIAIYTCPSDPASKPLESFYITKVRDVTKIPKERSHRDNCFDIITQGGAKSFSTHCPEVDYSDEQSTPNFQEEVNQWINSILSVSKFVGDLNVKDD